MAENTANMIFGKLNYIQKYDVFSSQFKVQTQNLVISRALFSDKHNF